MQCLTGPCHEIFSTFFYQKTPPWPNMNRQSWFQKIFRFRKDMHENLQKTCVNIVSDYADTQ